MNTKRRSGAFAILVAVMLAVTMMPAFASVANAEESGGSPSISTDMGNIKKGDKVYMGVRNINGSIVPISWLVLGGANSETLKNGDVSVDASDARLLIAEQIQGETAFNGENTSSIWQGSIAQTWCSDFLTGSDEVSDVVTDRFTAEEEAVPLSTSKSDGLFNEWGVSSLENERLFFLSAEEASDSNYFSNDDSRIAYWHDYDGTGDWWLRSPKVNIPMHAAYVTRDGFVKSGNIFFSGLSTIYGARPAFNFNIDLKSVLFTSAAAGGKSPSAAGDDALREISTNSTNEWKLTLHDSNRDVVQYIAKSGADLSVTEGYDSWSVSIIGETDEHAFLPVPKENEYVSVILAESSGKALYYGNIANGDMVVPESIAIPKGLVAGDYKLHIFSEEINEDKFTDYASAFSTIDLTVEAAPVETCTVTFYPAGGTWKDDNSTGTKTMTVEKGSSVTAPELTRDGYDFAGWYDDGGNLADFTNITSDLTVTAHWSEQTTPPVEKFTVTFSAEGGSWQDGTTANKEVIVEKGNAATAPAAPTKEGFTFDGWDTDFSNITSDLTVKAKWKKQVFVVKFLDEEGADPIMSQMVEYGDAATAPDDPTKEGYTFKGWDTDFSRITSDTTVTAVWEKNADPQPPAPVSIKDAKVVLSKTAFTYNAKVQKPAIKTIGGKVLAEGTDYTAVWSNKSSKNAGSYTVTITGKGNYTGTTKATYKINKAANPLTIKAKTATVKFSKLKKANQKLAVTKVIKFTRKAGDKKTYIKKSGNSKITIAKKTGKVTVKKGLAKGTYKVKVKVKAAGNTNYKASKVKTVTFKIIVK